MDKTYADTVRLLLAVAPDVFANDIFAMKGGTAINLFVRDMPRLSVDIDLTYLPVEDRAASLAAIDAAIEDVSGFRAGFGATSNRLDYIQNAISVQSENLTAANGRIRDVDVASEMASFTKNQILVQASTSMLAQANSMPQTALSLLG